MEETVLTWNFHNWLTVTLMVVVGFAAFGVASKAFTTLRSSAAS